MTNEGDLALLAHCGAHRKPPGKPTLEEKGGANVTGGVIMRGHPECHSEDYKVLQKGLDLASEIWVSEGQGLTLTLEEGSPAPRGLSLGLGSRPYLLWPGSARLMAPTPNPRLDWAERLCFHTGLTWKSLHPSPTLHNPPHTPPQRKDSGTTIISISF